MASLIEHDLRLMMTSATGNSSHLTNQQMPETRALDWRTGPWGVFTFFFTNFSQGSAGGSKRPEVLPHPYLQLLHPPTRHRAWKDSLSKNSSPRQPDQGIQADPYGARLSLEMEEACVADCVFIDSLDYNEEEHRGGCGRSEDRRTLFQTQCVHTS